MSLPEKILGLFEALSKDDIARLPKAKRERFRDICAHWAAIADPDGHQSYETIFKNAADACKAERRRSTGVLADLRATGGRQA